jgi:UDP-N-acetylmuramyl pentapeptide synthase
VYLESLLIKLLFRSLNPSIVYAVGEEIRYLWEEIDFQKKGALFQNVDQVILNLQDLFDNNDVVMLKASSKINFSKVIKEINTQKPIRKIA